MVEPYWVCVTCGSTAYPLTDDTECQCDIYEQDWVFVPAPTILCGEYPKRPESGEKGGK